MILFHNVHRLKITKIKFCKNNSIQNKHRVLEDFQLLPIIVENHLTNVGKLPTNPQILALAHHRNSSEVTTANLDSKSVFRPELKQRSSWNILTFFRDLLRTWFAMQGELNPYMIYHFQSEKPTMQAQHFFCQSLWVFLVFLVFQFNMESTSRARPFENLFNLAWPPLSKLLKTIS